MKVTEITPEMKQAVLRSLYHHPRSSPIITEMLTGERFDSPPPQPTEAEKEMAREIVEDLVALHYRAFREACIEVTGEDPETDWQ